MDSLQRRLAAAACLANARALFVALTLLLLSALIVPSATLASQKNRRQQPGPPVQPAQRAQTSQPTNNAGAQLLQDAAALLQAGRLEEAEALARRVVTDAPRDARAHALLGVILDQRGQSEEAERHY
nr:hypothetical protein [Acidobacteriota bacterium]